MARHIWSKLFVASLVFLGEGAFASETNHRNEVDAVTAGSIIQLSDASLLSDPEPQWSALHIYSYLSTVTPNFTLLTLCSVTFFSPAAVQYQTYNPRAPPITIS
jgi:hypothetical protein